MEGILIFVILAVAFIALIFICIVVSTQNNLVRLDRLCQESWAGIDIVLKRRYDLIPNLVACVKGYADHEKDTLEKLIQLRNQAISTQNAGARMETENALGTTLSGVVARFEAYPELQSSANFLQLQHELANTEDRIAAARRLYNNNIREYNVAIESFPGSLLRGNRSAKTMFTLDDPRERELPSARVG